MTQTWCMRYEAKHSYFKTMAAYIGNFTDRHQTHNCYLNNSARGNVENNLYCAKETTVGESPFLCYINSSINFRYLKKNRRNQRKIYPKKAILYHKIY